MITELTSPEVGYSEEFAQELTDAYTAIGNGLLGPEFPISDGIMGETKFADFVKEVIVPAMGN